VRPATIRAFTSRFAAAGLRPTALTPAYGLAESTLFVRAGDPTLPARGARYEREALGRGTARLVAPPSAGVVAGPGGTGACVELVSCGRACEGIELAVVDVDGPRPTRCAPDRVGEVWVRSASNGRGYWRQPAASRETFEAVLDGTGPWLRTGDLGFLDRNGELVVTGRRKDLMIIRGVNHYPQDFEQMVQSAHPALGSGLAAAFTDPEDEERVVVVVEAAAGDQDRELVEAAAAAARSVTAHLPVPTDVVVVSRATVPRTTSGKVRRAECAQRYGAHVLPELARWPRRVA
jgi:acyl-CoA synthetase (AMP-forming)/AMP-acid ligase II